MKIAETIYSQLRTQQVKVWSWGANSWTAFEKGLFFKVQGFKFDGIVKITLMPSDTYKLEFIKDKAIVNVYEDVYYDGMVDIIDRYVEYTDENYANDVNKAVYIF